MNTGLVSGFAELRGGWFAMLAALVWFAVAEARASGPPEAAFDAANHLYEQGKYAQAAAAFRGISQGGKTSPALLYNEGNAWFRAGELGKAIAAYTRAQRLAPRDPDILANLQFAREQVAQPTSPPGRTSRWFGRLSPNEWALLAMLAWWLVFGLLALGEVLPAARARLRRWAFVGGGFAAALAVGAVVAYRVWTAPRLVVASGDAILRAGPFEESPTVFTADKGAEFPVIDSKGDWFQVLDAKQRAPWIKRDAVEPLGRLGAP